MVSFSISEWLSQGRVWKAGRTFSWVCLASRQAWVGIYEEKGCKQSQDWSLPDSCLSPKWALISGNIPRKVASCQVRLPPHSFSCPLSFGELYKRPGA